MTIPLPLFTNAINTRTNGFDLVANNQRNLGSLGHLDLAAAYSFNRTKIVGTVATPSQLSGLEETLFDRIEWRRVEMRSAAQQRQAQRELQQSRMERHSARKPLR